MKLHEPEHWSDKTTLDLALWYFGIYNGKTIYEECCFFETDADWYPAFEIGEKLYVKATLFKHTSNLELYTICLAGNDDYSISKDCIGYDVAITEWLDLHAEQYVRPEHLKDHYFSN